jgi:hypothetical protein
MNYLIFLYLALFCVFATIVFFIFIVSELQKRGVKINFFLIRLLMPKYINQYKKITEAESGRPGSLFYLCTGSISLALIFAVIGIVLKSM